MIDQDPEDLIADAVEARLVELRRAGLPGDVILGTTLATVVGMIADLHGGAVAADAVRIVADRVADRPKRQRVELREMVPAGRA